MKTTTKRFLAILISVILLGVLAPLGAVTAQAGEPVTYTITYVANGASNVPAPQTKTHDVDLGITTSKPTAPSNSINQVFAGWTTSSGTYPPPVQYQANDLYIANASVTLYAVWVFFTTPHRIYFYANGGALNGPPSQPFYGTIGTAIRQIPRRIGFKFLGWANDPAATFPDLRYRYGSVCYGNNSIPLYAVWEADTAATYTVAYDANGGSGAMEPQTKKYGVDLPLSANTFTRPGYTFLGWNENRNAAAPDYLAGGLYTADAGATLFAVWKADRYNLNFYSSQSATTPLTIYTWHDQVFPLGNVTDIQPFTRPSCALTGWRDAATGVVYGLDDTITLNRDVDFYAVWVFSKDVDNDYLDTTENVMVYPAGIFADGTEMVVTEGNRVMVFPENGGVVVLYYDISFTGYGSAGPNYYPLAQEVTVRFTIPDDFNFSGGKLVIKHLRPDGTLVTIESELVTPPDGKRYIEFQTNHFSLYALVYVENTGPAVPAAPEWNGKSQEFTYKKGNTFTLALPAGAAVKEWATSNAKTATAEGGKVTLGTRGDATITVKLMDNTTWAYRVTVKFNSWQWLLYIFCFGWLWM